MSERHLNYLFNKIINYNFMLDMSLIPIVDRNYVKKLILELSQSRFIANETAAASEDKGENIEDV